MFQTSQTRITILETLNNRHYVERERVHRQNQQWRRAYADAMRRTDVMFRLMDIRNGKSQ